jgi:hypothetical protein
MTFWGFILSIVFILGGLTGVFVAYNTLYNWAAYGGDHNRLHRDIAYAVFGVGAIIFYMGLWGLFPGWLALSLGVLTTVFLGAIFWGGTDHIRWKLWDPGREEREMQQLLFEAEQADNLALGKVEDILESYVPAPGPFQAQYWDIAPFSEFKRIIITTQDTELGGRAIDGYDWTKMKSFREASSVWQEPLKELFRKRVSYGFTDEQRFRHQFIVASSGSGKTTLLSAQIHADLQRVVKGEASLFVMDSQNQLIPDIARLADFAPGGSLHGKLIYIEYDPDHPLSLNIFDFNKELMASLTSRQRVTLQRGTEEMITFFMQSLVRAETSGFMEGILKTVLRAVMLIPDATVLTFKDFLSKDGFAKHEQHLSTLSETDRRFLTADMFEGSYGPSIGAVRARLSAFTSDDLFLSMFTNPRNKFDLFKLLQEPKVILINTMEGMLKSAKEPFGRFFIAKLLQATEERMFVPKSSRLPVFAYIDEAQDYIKHDEHIRDLTEKARKQNVSLTIATHEVQDLDETVRNALRKVAIQFWPSANYPKWMVSVTGKEPIELTVPPIDFQNYSRMSEAQFQTILADMRNRFSVAPEIAKQTSALPPAPTSPQPQAPTDWER